MRYTVLLFFLMYLEAECQPDSIRLNNATLCYEVRGQGKPVVLLSGGPGISADQLSGLHEWLSQNHLSVLFEQRGTGRSKVERMDSTTINLNEAVNDLNLLKNKLAVPKLTIIGHSWGAMLAMHYANRFPSNVEKLILIGPGVLAFSDYDILEANIMARASIAERKFMDDALDSMAHNTASKELISAYNKQFIRFLIFDAPRLDSISKLIRGRQNPRMQQLMLQDLMRQNYNVKPGLQKLNIPIYVICGREDPVGVFPTFEISQLNKKAQISWIEKSGHFPWIEKPESFYKVLAAYLR